MPVIVHPRAAPPTIGIDPACLKANAFSLSVYGDPSAEIDDLMPSVREHGVLVPLVVAAPGPERGTWEVISGHRRLALRGPSDWPRSPARSGDCRAGPPGRPRSWSTTASAARHSASSCAKPTRSRRSGDPKPSARRLANLRKGCAGESDGSEDAECRDSDARAEREDSGPDAGERAPSRGDGRGRTDAAIARHLGMGGKDLYRQAPRHLAAGPIGRRPAQSGVAQLDGGTKTIHAAYKDLRRRDRFGSDFRPTPYDVWPFRHDRAFGIPHPGSIPPALVAHALHYYTAPGALVVDPMAGGGTTLDVCQSMGRRCLAYDLHPARPEIRPHDIRIGFPPETSGCDLIFCDPPYHTMLARHYARDAVSSAPLSSWIAFLHDLARHAFHALRPGGCLALLLAAQTEKDLPAGFGYLDHAFFGYAAAPVPASSPSGGSVARWTAPICPSTSAAPATRVACSARCVTCS